MDGENQQRRRLVRLSSRLHAGYKVIGSDLTHASLTIDTGGGGVGFFTHQRLAPGTILEVTLQFPERAGPLRFKGEVVWSGRLLLDSKSTCSETYETGVRFLEINPKDLAYIVAHSTGMTKLKDSQAGPTAR